MVRNSRYLAYPYDTAMDDDENDHVIDSFLRGPKPQYAQVNPDPAAAAPAAAPPIDPSDVDPPDDGAPSYLDAQPVEALNSLGGQTIQAPPPPDAPPPMAARNNLGGAVIQPASEIISHQAPSANPGAIADDADYRQAQADLKDHYTGKGSIQGRPEMTDPKWYQRLGAMGFAGLAGYVNAEGRIKTPIDIGAATEGILHPGYQGKLERWTANIAKQKDLVGIEGEKLAERLKSQKSAADVNHLNAEAEYARGQGRAAYVRVSKEMAAASGNRYHENDMIPAMIAKGLDDAAANRWVKPAPREQTERVDTQEMADLLGKKLGDWVPISTYNSVLARPKPPAPEPAAAAKQNFQRTISKLSSEGNFNAAGISDVKVLAKAINASRVLTPQEKNDALGYMTANTTPAATGTAATIRMEGLGNTREYSVINKSTGQLEMRSASEINGSKGNFAPAGPGATAMGKGAIFADLHYNIDTARKAIQALHTMDPGTRAALAYTLRHTDPKSAMDTFLTGAIGTNLNPQQQEAVQSLALLAENAMSLRSVAGMGQGSDDLRSAILATIPGAKSPSIGYAQHQLDKFEQVVKRLEGGVPGMNAPGSAPAPAGPGRGAPPAAPAAKADAGYIVGGIYGGKKYLGGDHLNGANWR